jgi:2-keto-4-pentenoate hydratase/2-oxohepta-3-ene-1,7-dioic acid hydratase in catechol pathway
MRLVSFRTRAGQTGWGQTADGTVVHVADSRHPTLRDALAGGAPLEVRGAGSHKLEELTLLPPIPNPDKIICVGLNYRSHILETGREPPTQPVIFTRFANSQVGHDQPMVRPRVSTHFDFEGELAVIIGRNARHVGREQALDYVAGYSCYNDGSIRDWQRHTHQYTPGKNFPATGAFGPWLVTRDEIPDPSTPTLTTRLNGAEVQHAPLSDLLFDVPAIIEYCSTFTELVPGDVIVTGTTGGVGAARKPPLWMKAGDVIEVEISGIGTLRNTIVDEA